MPQINYRDAFRQVLKRWHLSQADLCRASAKRITPPVLSSFLKGEKDIGTDRLHSLVKALPPDAEAYFYQLVYPPASPMGTATDQEDPGHCEGEIMLDRLERFLSEGHCSSETFTELLGVLAKEGHKVHSSESSD